MALVGRSVTVPRRVFARDISSGDSEEPPDGVAWKGVVKGYDPKARPGYTITLRVHERNDAGDVCEGQEEHSVSMEHLRAWIDLAEGERREQVGRVLPSPAAAVTVEEPARPKAAATATSSTSSSKPCWWLGLQAHHGKKVVCKGTTGILEVTP